MNKARRLTAFLLVAALCCNLLTVLAYESPREDYLEGSFVFGEDDASEQYRIVVLGDSTTNGYYMNDYAYFTDGKADDDKEYLGTRDHSNIIYDILKIGAESRDKATNFGVLNNASHEAVAYQIGAYVKGVKGENCQVISTNLAIEGSRCDEIHALLDETYVGDAMVQENMTAYEEWFQEYVGVGAREAFQSSVENADCIVLDSVMNNFCTYVLKRLRAVILQGDMETYDDSYEDVQGAYTPYAFGSVATFARDAMLKLVEAFSKEAGITIETDMIEEITDMLIYCYCDFCSNYTETVRLLREMNPDAKIIACGAYHTMSELEIELMGITLDVDTIVNTFMSFIDAFVQYGCAYRNEYAYAGLEDGISSFADELKNAETIADIYPAFDTMLTGNIMQYYDSYTALCDEMGIAPEERMTAEQLVQNGKQVILDSVKNNVIDVADTIEYVLGADLSEEILTVLINGTLEDAPTGISVILNGMARMVIGTAIGIHPGVKGYQKKCEAVEEAWEFLEDGGCVASVPVYSASGSYTMKLNNEEAGRFTIKRCGTGWSIYDESRKQYLSFQTTDYTLAYTDEPFVWSYNSGFYVNASTKSMASDSRNRFCFGNGSYKNGDRYGRNASRNVQTKYYLNLNEGTLSVSDTVQIARLYTSYNTHIHAYGSTTCLHCGKKIA